MIKRTYGNMLKATKMIAMKGYVWDKANELAIQCFEQMMITKNGMPVEWFIDKIENCK